MRKIKLASPLRWSFFCIILTFGYWLLPWSWTHDNVLFSLLSLFIATFFAYVIAKEREVSLIQAICIVGCSFLFGVVVALLFGPK